MNLRRWFGLFPFRRRQGTLLSKIILWMFGPLFLLWSIGLVITWFIAQNIANTPYDRILAGHLRMLKHEVEQQALSSDIRFSPTTALLLSSDGMRTFHWEIYDSNGNSVAGNAHIPMPESWTYEADLLRFRDATLNGESVRVAYLWGGRDQGGIPFLTIVAQSNQMRATLQQEILTGMLTPQLIVLPLAALLAALGLTQGLEPLTVLQEHIRSRRANDTTPIRGDIAPDEIVPLINAMNELLDRMVANNEAQRRFVANAAHQLKTPLAGMRTQAELALRETSSQKVNASLQQLVLASERATRLVNQMLVLARTDSADTVGHTNLELVDLVALAGDLTARFVERAIHKQIDLGFEGSPHSMLVRGNRLMLGEMVSNLLDNSLLYTPAGGRVTARVGGDRLSTYIEVEDSGVGIPLADRERVFDRFFRVLGSSVEGSGLGLAIVKEIAEQHGASIAFMPLSPQRSDATGTCLRITFARFHAA